MNGCKTLCHCDHKAEWPSWAGHTARANSLGPAHGKEKNPSWHTLSTWAFQNEQWSFLRSTTSTKPRSSTHLSGPGHSSQGPSHYHPSSLNPHGVVHGGRRQGNRGMSPDTCPPGPWLGKVAGHLEEHLVEEERPRASPCFKNPTVPVHTGTPLCV